MKALFSFENPSTQLLLGAFGLVGLMVLSSMISAPSWPLTFGIALLSTIILARFLAILGLPMLLAGFLAAAFWVAMEFPTLDIWNVLSPLAMAFFGLVLGSRLNVDYLKRHLVPTVVLSALLTLITLVCVGLSYLVLDHTFRLGIPAFSPEHRVLYAVAFGVLSIFAAPVITLSVCQQRGVWGNLAQAVLGVTVFIPIFGALLFPIFQDWAFSVLEIGGLSVGAFSVLWRSLTLGALFSVLTFSITRLPVHLHAPGLGVIFAIGAWLTIQVDALTFLTFLPVGLILTRKECQALAADLQGWTTPVSLLFFLLLGLSMGLNLDESTLVIALVIIAGRAAGISLSVGRIAAFWPRFAPAEMRKSLFATGTLSFYFASELAHTAPFFVPVVQVMAWVVVGSAVLGAVTLDNALLRTGEDATQPEDVEEKVENLIPMDVITEGRWLDSRGFKDRWLSGRLRELRGVVLSSYEPIFQAVNDEHARALRCLEDVQNSVELFVSVLNDPETRENERLSHIAHIIQGFRQMDLELDSDRGVTAKLLSELDAVLVSAESEGRSLKVELEEAFYQTSKGASLPYRALVMFRRARRMVFGSSVRNVPIGRIWHYEVRLAMPVTMRFPVVRTARRMSTTWQHIAELTRDTSTLLLDAQTIWKANAEPEAIDQLKVRCAHLIKDIHATHEVLLRSRDLNVRECATRASENFDGFLFAVARSGTLEWPSFRFRLSARYDQATRGLASTERQIARHNAIRDASIGQTALWLTRLRFDEWYLDFMNNVSQAIQRNLQSTVHMERIKEHADAEPELIDSMLHATADVLRVRSARFAENEVTADALRRLERRVATLPKELTVLSQQRQPQVVAVRDAVQNEVMREVALVLLEGNELAEKLLRRSHAQITELRQNIATQTDQDGRAKTIRSLVDKHREQSEELVEERRRLLRERCTGLVERVVKRPTFWRRADPTTERAKQLYERASNFAAPVINRLVIQFESRLSVPDAAEARIQIHQWTAAFEEHVSRLPAMYRRLYDTNVVDIADFYVSRPKQEEALIEALKETRLSILVHGNQGVGKTSLVHHVLDRSESTSSRRVAQIRLMRGMSDEAILSELAVSLKISEENIERGIRKLHDRPILILENADEFFYRTLDGFRRFARLLDFISKTSSQISWIVVMRSPTLTMLDTSLGMRDYFSHVLEIPDFEPDALTELILKRHRASGYSVDYGEVAVWNRWLRKKPEDALFEDLCAESNGNPLLAQHLWLSALRRKNEGSLTAEEVMPPPRQMIRSCHIDQQHILAALIRHRSMSIEELHQVLRVSRSTIERELTHLIRLGLVKLHLDLADRFEVSSLFSMTLEHELQEENVL